MNASDMPFDCGLAAGVVIGIRCRRSAVQRVSGLARWADHQVPEVADRCSVHEVAHAAGTVR